jgi:hypothetical protein
LLQSGAMDFAIAGDPADMLASALRLAVGAGPADPRPRGFGIYTRFNLPAF